MIMNAAMARDVLHKRLEAVFTPEVFGALYPGAKVPKVFLGFPVTEPPFYAAVDEIADAAETRGAVTMGHDEVVFTLRVWLCAQHTDLKTASDALLAYIDAVFGAIMADPQLNMSVDNSFPSIEAAGTAADSSKRYIAAASVAISCSAWSVCPASLAEAVAQSNEDFNEGGANESQGD